MRYTMVLESTGEPEYPGWYYTHIPALDLTTHGQGVEGAPAAAREFIGGWIAELRAGGQSVPEPGQELVTQIEVTTDALPAA